MSLPAALFLGGAVLYLLGNSLAEAAFEWIQIDWNTPLTLPARRVPGDERTRR